MKRRTTDGAGDGEQMGSENRNKDEKRLIDKYVTGSVEMWRNRENHDGDNGGKKRGEEKWWKWKREWMKKEEQEKWEERKKRMKEREGNIWGENSYARVDQ